ncbi:hypothetical protein PG987_005006 [Apiospora arundinis]
MVTPVRSVYSCFIWLFLYDYPPPALPLPNPAKDGYPQEKAKPANHPEPPDGHKISGSAGGDGDGDRGSWGKHRNRASTGAGAADGAEHRDSG